MNSIEYASELNKIRKIACLAIISSYSYLQSRFFVFQTHYVWFPSPILPSLRCVCNTIVCSGSQGYSGLSPKCLHEMCYLSCCEGNWQASEVSKQL